MAALRKKERSPYWFACITLPDGRRVQRSTKETTRKEAQKKADEWERLSKERAKAKQAHRVIADIYKAAHKAELPESTPSSFVTTWLARRKGEIAPASYAAYSGRVSHFLEWLGDGAKRPLADLETRHFISYRDALAERLSTSTANQGIKLLRVIFEAARRDHLMAENPAKDCGLLKKETTAARRPFTLDEIRLVLATAGEEWRSMVLLGIYTGQRLSDIARLTWANVDTVSEEIHLRTRKTERPVRIPICTPLMQHIQSLPAGDDVKSPLHPRASAMVEAGSQPVLSREFADLLAAAGIAAPRERKANGKGRSARRNPSELSFHSLRHTATSLMKNAGISPAIVQDIIGHDSAEMNAHYTHIESQAKREALNKMPDLLKK